MKIFSFMFWGLGEGSTHMGVNSLGTFCRGELLKLV
jgi:hypothetical protein